ncbi:DUF397 domain-containing protein [Streptomyces sp. BPTC-684]|uniref:DUF397 domain-containing protein n=1 Tax=Streptomyces sp. BPTC-684 TaxID=3043734 RepID=UPI0024B2182C|nr:DUF397 domain-containing protein [Streptomyces sp. BPTC-684]WHM38732.1 DUF397 domain-containing protein [Streptomyces sp. BPTC-684]
MDLTDAQWRKSSYSGGGGGDCVEVADLPHAVAIRDSKRPEGAALTVSPAAFTAFVDGVTRRA